MVTNVPVAPIHRQTVISSSSRLWVSYVLVVTIIVALVGGLATVAVMLEKQRYQERATTATQNIALLLDSHISDVLDHIDSELKTAAHYYSVETARGSIDGSRINAFIRQQEGQQKYLENLRILDKEGILRFGREIPLDKPINSSDRPFYQQARDKPDAGLIVYGPVQSKITQKWVMVLARRLNASDGSFAGVVYANLATAQFEKTFSAIELGRAGAATLRTTDLALVHRVPDSKNAIGSKEVSAQLSQAIRDHPDAGLFHAKTAIDGIERSNAYRRLQRYPFYVIVGLATNDYLGGWVLNAFLVSLLAGMAILLTGFAGWRTYWAHSFAVSSLQRERELKAAIVESSEDAIIAKSPDGRVTSWNAGAQSIFGFSADEMVGRPMVHLYPSEDADQSHSVAARLSRGETVEQVETDQLRKDGTLVSVSSTISPLRNEQGQVMGVSIIARDITERKKADANLRLAASVFTHAHEGIVITDSSVNIVDANQIFEQIAGYSRVELLGNNPRISSSGRQDAGFYDAMWAALKESGFWSGEIWNRRKSGELYPALLTISSVRNDKGVLQNYVGILSDITPLKDYQLHLEHVAYHDALTGLPNRILFADRLTQAIAQSQRHGRVVAVAYLDLDGFKAINDTHGHDVGDELLINVSRRMKEVLREGDTLARLGGDEFVAILVDFDDKTECEPVLQRLLNAVADPIRMGDLQLSVSASIGVSIFPMDASDADQLMRRADHAMYDAKQGGKGRIQWFCEGADGPAGHK